MLSLAYTYKSNFIFDTNDLFKFLFFIPYFFLALFLTNPLYQLVLFLNMTIVFLAAKRSQVIKQILKFSLFLAIMTFIINILLRRDGSTVLIAISLDIFNAGPFIITKEVLIISAISVFQLVIILVAFGLINNLINPDVLMKNFTRLKMPYVIYLMLSISIRFFPILIDDVNVITQVQRTRGLKMESGSLRNRIKNRISIMFPLLINSLERSIQLSEAIEARGFGETKTRSLYNYKKIPCELNILLVFHYIFMMFLIYFHITERVGYWQLIPTLNIYELGDLGMVFLLLLFLINLIEIGIIWGVNKFR